MRARESRPIRRAALIFACVSCVSCGKGEPGPAPPSSTLEAKVAPTVLADTPTLGSVDVTAKLVEVPEGAIFKRDLYDYATVLKYEVVEVHRGKVDGPTLYVGQYNPFKPRGEAADRRVKDVGGDLKSFRAGQVHRLKLEVPIDDHFMGGIVNKYFEATTGPIYWAVRTDLVGG